MKIRTILTAILISCAAAVLLAEPEPTPASGDSSAEWQRAQEEMKQKEQKIRRKAEEIETTKRQLRDITGRVPIATRITARRRPEIVQQSAGRILIIPSGDTKPEQLDAINEDLLIMSRILAKQLGQQFDDSFVVHYIGSVLNMVPAPDTVFIDGYGALFVFEVDFLLSPPQQKEGQEAEEAVDSEWDRTKKELFSPSQIIDIREYKESERKAQYDEEKVKKIERDLIGALKHAANIRDLDEGEQLVIVIRSVEEFTGAKFKFLSGDGSKIVLPSRTTGSKTSQATDTMVIRVDKKHIDEFSEGKLSYDEFRDKVEVIKY